MSEIALKPVVFGGIRMEIPEIWEAVTQTYTEPDGRECSMIDISAADGDPRSIVISYGPMPEGSDTFMEASDTYEELIGETGAADDEDPICEYDFLGTVGFGFEVPTEGVTDAFAATVVVFFNLSKKDITNSSFIFL